MKEKCRLWRKVFCHNKVWGYTLAFCVTLRCLPGLFCLSGIQPGDVWLGEHIAPKATGSHCVPGWFVPMVQRQEAKPDVQRWCGRCPARKPTSSDCPLLPPRRFKIESVSNKTTLCRFFLSLLVDCVIVLQSEELSPAGKQSRKGRRKSTGYQVTCWQSKSQCSVVIRLLVGELPRIFF